MGHAYKKLTQRHQGAAILALLMCLVCLIITTPRASAQQGEASNLSTEFMAGFAFFKLAKAKPDFITWVKNSPAYMQGTPAIRSNLLRGEVLRLQGAFDYYVVREQPITVKAQIKFQVPTETLAKRMLSESGSVTIPIKMVQDTEFLFPLQVGDMWIALIPQYLEQMLEMTLNAQEYETFRQGMEDYRMQGTLITTLKLELLPKAVDIKAPLQIQKVDLWALLADIIGFEIMSKDGSQMVWYRDIPGFEKYNRNQDVYHLFKN